MHCAGIVKSSTRLTLSCATSLIFYFSFSILVPSFAEIGTQITSPPNASGISPFYDKSSMTASISASGLSILLMATMRGMRMVAARSITSTVCYWTLSTAEITKMMMSVTLAPRDLMF